MRRIASLLTALALASAASAQKAPTPGKIEVSLHKVVSTDTMQLTILGTLAKGDTLVPMSHLRDELATTKKDLQDVVNDYVTLRAYTVKVTDSLKAELKKKQSCPPPKTP
jgi:hypothetical protein